MLSAGLLLNWVLYVSWSKPWVRTSRENQMGNMFVGLILLSIWLWAMCTEMVWESISLKLETSLSFTSDNVRLSSFYLFLFAYPVLSLRPNFSHLFSNCFFVVLAAGQENASDPTKIADTGYDFVNRRIAMRPVFDSFYLQQYVLLCSQVLKILENIFWGSLLAVTALCISVCMRPEAQAGK